MKKLYFSSVCAAVAVFLSACSSQPNTAARACHIPANADVTAQFGAKTAHRHLQNQTFMPVRRVDNQSAVRNQGDFLSQLSNIKTYSPRLYNNNDGLYQKITQWVLSGANVKQLAQYGIQSEIMSGQDGYQNVLMTGYYSPVIHARRTQQGKYRHPIHQLPSNKKFTRAQIYQGALNNKGLELAYSDSMLDNFLLGVQGSGYVDFGDGKLNYFAYAGQNGFQYTSIGRLLVEDGEIAKEKMSIQAIRDWAERNPHRLQALLERNQSYVFFKNDPYGKVRGSAGVPLVEMASLASDRSIVPTGSILLVEVPGINPDGSWDCTHQLHLMAALDVGGAVKGQHFDLYRGIGDDAGKIAGLSKHYGRVWILR